MIKSFVISTGRFTASLLDSVGRITIMGIKTLKAIKKAPTYIDQVIKSFIYIGKDSVPLLVTSAVFMGLVVGLQIGMGAGPLTPPWVEGAIVIKLVFLEMGPVVFGLLLAGRISAGISSEIGEMNVTEQIDALRTSAIDPVEYIVMPRLLAGIIAVPMLIIWGDLISILFGFVSTHFISHLSWAGYLKGMRSGFVSTDMYTSLIKGFVFGFIMTQFGCFFGINARYGAKGVGRATTYAVIWSSIILIIVDYLLSGILSLIW